MNQIFFQALSQDSLKTPGISLRSRWLFAFLPRFEILCGFFLLPLLGTLLGHIFIDLDDLYTQVFSLDGLIYLGMLMRMIPKPYKTSKREMEIHVLTAQSNAFYFLELLLFAYIGLVVSYEVSWLMSISFSTMCAFSFYAILWSMGASSSAYLKTILRIYAFGNLGVILALGLFSPFYIYKILLFIGFVFLIYHLVRIRYPMNLLRCILWGILSVWIDYWGCSLFYILEMVFAKDGQNRVNPFLMAQRALIRKLLR